MKTTNAAGPEVVRRLLIHEGRGHPDPGERVASAATHIYSKICQHFGPIVGQAGVQALFARSLRLASAEHRFLGAVAPAVGQLADTSDGLRPCLLAQSADAATAATVTIFATFFGHLSAIIGEGLVTQLLADAWPDLSWTPLDERNP